MATTTASSHHNANANNVSIKSPLVPSSSQQSESMKESWKQEDSIEPFNMDSFMQPKKKVVKKVVKRRVVVKKDEQTGQVAPVLPQPAGDDPLDGIGPHRRVLRRKDGTNSTNNHSSTAAGSSSSRVLSGSSTFGGAEDGGEVVRPDLHTVCSDGAMLIRDSSSVVGPSPARRRTVTVAGEGDVVIDIEESSTPSRKTAAGYNNNNINTTSVVEDSSGGQEEYEEEYYEEYEEVIFLDDSTTPSSCGTSLNFGALKAALNNAYSRRQSLESCVSAMTDLEPFMSGEFALLNGSGGGANRSSETPKHLLATARAADGPLSESATDPRSPKLLSPSTSGGSWFRGFRQKVQAIDTKIEAPLSPQAEVPEQGEVGATEKGSDSSPFSTGPIDTASPKPIAPPSLPPVSLFPRRLSTQAGSQQQASTGRRRSIQPTEFLPSLPPTNPQTARAEVSSSRQRGARPVMPSVYAPPVPSTPGQGARRSQQQDHTDQNLHKRWIAGGRQNGLFGAAPEVHPTSGGGTQLPSLRPQPPHKTQGPARPLWR